MYFALFYIFFFALDILLVSRFRVLGMAPMFYLVAGVGFFCCFFIGKRFSVFSISSRYSFIHKLFFAFVLIISIQNFSEGVSHLLKLIRNINLQLQFIPDWIFCVFSFSLSLLIVFLIPLKSSLSRWMLYSTVTGFIRYGVPVVFGLPQMLHRFMGVFDLIMLFGWLMIIVTLLRMEFDFGRTVIQKPAVR